MDERSKREVGDEAETLVVEHYEREGWTVRDVARHVVDVQGTFAGFVDRELQPFASVDDEVTGFDLVADDVGAVRHVFDDGLVAIVQRDTTAPMFAVRVGTRARD